MKECDKREKHISSKLHMINISSNMVDTLLLRPSLHFTTVVFQNVTSKSDISSCAAAVVTLNLVNWFRKHY